MILMRKRREVKSLSFTRMSGDDPQLTDLQNNFNEFYPHERG